MLCLQEQQSHNKETPTQQTACNKTILQGGNRHRVISARPTNMRLPLRYSRVRSGPSITARTWLFTAHRPHLFSHSSFSPPFHHATSCPTRHRADAWGQRSNQVIENARYITPLPRARRTPLIPKGTKCGVG